MSDEILKTIKRKIQERVARKELYSIFTNSKEIDLINNCVSDIKNGEISPEESNLLKGIYEGLDLMVSNISIDWDSNRGSLSSKKIDIHYQNLRSISKILTIIGELNRSLTIFNGCKLMSDISPLQKKMEEALEKMQQQSTTSQKQKEHAELEKKAKEEFGKYINGTIDGVSIEKYKDLDLFYATITLKDDNKSTDVKISEFLNDDFCRKNDIAGFLILNGNQEKIIYGFIDKKVRHYDLGATVQYEIKFNWYIDGKECSITLGANSDGSIRIVGDRPTDTDLERNKGVKIKVGNDYLNLVEAVKTCKQKGNEAPSEHFRPVQTPVQSFPTFQEISNCSHNT